METQYEVTEKSTGTVAKVTAMAFGEEIVTATTAEFGDLVFQNPNKSGELSNDLFTITEVGTHNEADGDTPEQEAGEAPTEGGQTE